MSSNRNQRRQLARGRNGEISISEQIEESSLPSAEHLAAYAQVDPDLPRYFREVTTREQDFRHDMGRKGVNLGQWDLVLTYALSFASLLASVAVAGGGMFLAWKLIEAGHDVKGSIFGGTTILLMAALFLRRGQGSRREKEK